MTNMNVHPHYAHRLRATPLGRGRYAVRPDGQLGTCGFYPKAWTVVYVDARNVNHALAKARARVWE